MAVNQLHSEFNRLEISIDRIFNEFQVRFLTDAKILFEKAFEKSIDFPIVDPQSGEGSNEGSDDSPLVPDYVESKDQVSPTVMEFHNLLEPPLLQGVVLNVPMVVSEVDSKGLDEQKQLVTNPIEDNVFDEWFVITDIEFDGSISGLLELPQNENHDILEKDLLGKTTECIMKGCKSGVESIEWNQLVDWITLMDVVNHKTSPQPHKQGIAGILMVHNFEFQLLLVNTLVESEDPYGFRLLLMAKKDYDSRLNLLLLDKSEKKLVMKGNEVFTKLVNGLQLSLTQGIVSSHYRNYEIWVTGMVKSFVNIWWFTWRMKSLTGTMGVSILNAYMLLGLSLLRIVTLDFGNLTSLKQQLEETFRFMHERLQQIHAKSFDFFGEGAREKAMVMFRFRELLDHSLLLLKKKWMFGILDDFVMKQLPHIVTWGLSLLYTLDYKKDLSLVSTQIEVGHSLQFLASVTSQSFLVFGDIMELNRKFLKPSENINRIFELEDEELLDVVQFENSRTDKLLLYKGTNLYAKGVSSFCNVDIITPSEKLLAGQLKCDAVLRKNLLVISPNSSRKCSVFKVLRGLWPIPSGTNIEELTEIFFDMIFKLPINVQREIIKHNYEIMDMVDIFLVKAKRALGNIWSNHLKKARMVKVYQELLSWNFSIDP